MQPILFLVGGFVLVVVGAESLVAGARRVALRLGVSPIVIGLTVVAFGTSAPELVVSVRAALSENAAIAVGNVVGSNIFNVLFILGLSAMLTPLVVAQQLVRVDVPLMILVSVAAWIFALDGVVERVEGLVFVIGIVVYAVLAVRTSKRETKAIQGEYDEAFASDQPGESLAISTVRVVGGLAGLMLGAGWLIRGATAVALSLGISELVIGLTIVAGGTSLPEVATSVVASLKGERDIAVGNIVGSNLFNLLAVLGVSSVVAESGMAIPATVLRFDIPVMVITAVLCLPIFFSGYVITRWEGAVLLTFYVLYVVYLVLGAGQSAAFDAYRRLVLLPVLLGVALISVRAWRDVRASARSP